MKNVKPELRIHLAPGQLVEIHGTMWMYLEMHVDKYRFVHIQDQSSELLTTHTALLEALHCGEVTIIYESDRNSSSTITHAEFMSRLFKAYFKYAKDYGKPTTAKLLPLLAGWSQQVQATKPNKTLLVYTKYPTPSPRAFLARLKRYQRQLPRT